MSDNGLLDTHDDPNSAVSLIQAETAKKYSRFMDFLIKSPTEKSITEPTCDPETNIFFLKVRKSHATDFSLLKIADLPLEIGTGYPNPGCKEGSQLLFLIKLKKFAVS